VDCFALLVMTSFGHATAMPCHDRQAR
jgi:hypothetical protein